MAWSVAVKLSAVISGELGKNPNTVRPASNTEAAGVGELGTSEGAVGDEGAPPPHANPDRRRSARTSEKLRLVGPPSIKNIPDRHAFQLCIAASNRREDTHNLEIAPDDDSETWIVRCSSQGDSLLDAENRSSPREEHTSVRSQAACSFIVSIFIPESDSSDQLGEKDIAKDVKDRSRIDAFRPHE